MRCRSLATALQAHSTCKRAIDLRIQLHKIAHEHAIAHLIQLDRMKNLQSHVSPLPVTSSDASCTFFARQVKGSTTAAVNTNVLPPRYKQQALTTKATIDPHNQSLKLQLANLGEWIPAGSRHRRACPMPRTTAVGDCVGTWCHSAAAESFCAATRGRGCPLRGSLAFRWQRTGRCPTHG